MASYPNMTSEAKTAMDVYAWRYRDDNPALAEYLRERTNAGRSVKAGAYLQMLSRMDMMPSELQIVANCLGIK